MKKLSNIIEFLTALTFFVGITATLTTGDSIYVILGILAFMVGFPLGIACKMLEE